MWDQGLNVFSMLLLYAGAACLVIALIVHLATRWISAFDVPYLTAYLAVVLCVLATLAIDIPLGMALNATEVDPNVGAVAEVSLTPVYYAVNSWVLPSPLDIGFWQGAGVMLLVLAVGALLAIGGFAAVMFFKQAD